MNITIVGIDIAKNVFQLHGADSKGETVFRKRLSRKKLVDYIAQIEPCLIAMEACGGANHWARKFKAMGHEVKLISPQFVRPYVKSNKNDANDAEAISEAASRPNMRFVSAKTIEQEDTQALHRIRSRIVRERTALVNQIRGLLAEYGIVISQGVNQVRKLLPEILEDAKNELSGLGRELFSGLLEELREIDIKVKNYDRKIERLCMSMKSTKMLTRVRGVGAITATAIQAVIGDARVFKNGREMAAYLGLVPRQYSSGDKQRLLRISKRGDKYLRTLLVHGARAALFRSKEMPKNQQEWLRSLIERRGINRAVVALANKNARLLWAIMTKGDEFNFNTL